MENTAKPVVEVIVEKNSVQIHGAIGCINNFVVYEKGAEPHEPWASGEFQQSAIEAFKNTWMLKRDEEIEVKVIETKIV